MAFLAAQLDKFTDHLQIPPRLKLTEEICLNLFSIISWMKIEVDSFSFFALLQHEIIDPAVRRLTSFKTISGRDIAIAHVNALT